MAKVIADQVVTKDYALYLGDSCAVLPTLRDESVHLSLYSPPFCGLYQYSSSERDLSNSRTYQEFFEHYEYIVSELYRLAPAGRITGVHCMDCPRNNTPGSGLIDFPGDIIRLHEKIGFRYFARYHVWKEPLKVRNRTMAVGLAHKQVVTDASICDVASADYLLMFRKKGKNKLPVQHPDGLTTYAGSRKMPAELDQYRGWTGPQRENKRSHWIWRNYASSFWDDIRIDRVLPYKESREPDDEKHVHPLQLDVIERAVSLYTNPGETVLSPFMGVGSEVFGAVVNGRRGVGIELKKSYFRQAVWNLETAKKPDRD